MMGHNSSDKTTQLLTRLVSIHNKTNLQYFQRLLFAQFSIVNPSQESLYLGLSHRLCSKANDAYFSLVFLFLISNKQNLTSSSSSSSTNSTLVTDLIYSFTNINSSSFSFSNKINLHVPSSAIISRLLLLSQNYLEISHSLTLPLNGIIHHSLIALLNSSLADFNRLVAVLHGNNLTLIRLLLWTRNPLSRLETINNLLKSTSTLKGGALLSFLFQGVSHGNPSISVFYNHLVTECFKPFAKLCVDWMEQGSIYDPTNEFFVKIISGKHLNVWKNRDVLVNDMIPSFMSESTIQQSIYFIRNVCNDTAFSITFKSPFEFNNLPTTQISNLYKKTSTHLLSLITNKFNLNQHFNAIKKYMLLSQGDFIETLMHNVSIELNKPAKVLYRHNLLNHLETSIRSTSICDESIEILSKIDINISNDHEIGWDCFQLTYNFTSPLNSVFDDMSIYDKMFTILWKLKRVRYCVSECWNGNVDGLILFEMIHFIDQILYYFNMVVEGCWMVFSNLVDNSHDFQEMITIHENFLVELSKKGMVSNQHDVIMKRLDCVFECIIGFKNVDGDGLDLFGKKFRALVVGFLKVLAIDSDQELRELGQRINFNDFYSF